MFLMVKQSPFLRIAKILENFMATTKTVNYTAEQTLQAVSMYQAGDNVEKIATLLAKTTRSIIAKLSREGVYKAKEYKTKAGEPVTAKDELAEKICVKANLPLDMAESIAKANKQALVGILSALNRT
jgi:predicted RecA/RadA family phage recombinase